MTNIDNNLIHIALIGGQTMPIYLALRETEAGKVLLIHSAETKQQAEKVRTDISFEKPDRSVELIEIKPYDYRQIREAIENLLDSLAAYTVEVNVSGGTKPWCIVFGMLAGTHKNLQLLYVDQNSVIYNYATSESHNLAGSLSIAEIFRLNQTVVSNHTTFDAYTETDLDVLERVKSIRRKYPKTFNVLTIPNKKDKNRYANNIKDAIADPTSCSEIRWDKKYQSAESATTQQYVLLYFVDKCGRHEEFELISPHAFNLVTSSGWFEYELATILHKWSACKEVWLNTIFPYDNKMPKNEIDIIAMVEQKLLFVECKTQVFDNTDIDKFAAAVKNYGGLGAKAIFITQQNMSTNAIDKCETNGIAHFSLFDGANKSVKYKELYDLLKKLVQTSNTR